MLLGTENQWTNAKETQQDNRRQERLNSLVQKDLLIEQGMYTLQGQSIDVPKNLPLSI